MREATRSIVLTRRGTGNWYDWAVFSLADSIVLKRGEVLARSNRWAKSFASQDSDEHWYLYRWSPVGQGDQWIKLNGKKPKEASP